MLFIAQMATPLFQFDPAGFKNRQVQIGVNLDKLQIIFTCLRLILSNNFPGRARPRAQHPGKSFAPQMAQDQREPLTAS